MSVSSLKEIIQWAHETYFAGCQCPFCPTIYLLRSQKEVIFHLEMAHSDKLGFPFPTQHLFLSRRKYFCWDCPGKNQGNVYFDTKQQLDEHLDRNHHGIHCWHCSSFCKTSELFRKHLMTQHHIIHPEQLDCEVKEQQNATQLQHVWCIDDHFITYPLHHIDQQPSFSPPPSPLDTPFTRLHNSIFCPPEIVPDSFVPMTRNLDVFLFVK